MLVLLSMGTAWGPGVGEKRDVHRWTNDGSRHSAIGLKPARKNITSSPRVSALWDSYRAPSLLPS